MLVLVSSLQINIYLYKEDCLYLFMSCAEKVSHCLFCSVFVFSACEFLSKAVIFKWFRFSVVLIDNMAF